MANKIRSGTKGELKDRAGDWLFVDLGFAKENETCGYFFVPQDTDSGNFGPKKLTFGKLVECVIELACYPKAPPLNVVLEAPLSAAFSKSGNPLGREGERKGAKTRYWYQQGGCVVLVAALYLFRAVMDCRAKMDAGLLREIRIFEGFVSFKDGKSDHVADVLALKSAVWNGDQAKSFLTPKPINTKKGQEGSALLATFRLLGLEIDPPEVIVANAAKLPC